MPTARECKVFQSASHSHTRRLDPPSEHELAQLVQRSPPVLPEEKCRLDQESCNHTTFLGAELPWGVVPLMFGAVNGC
eukprot:1149603-Pelagomonas_calceolata.AAC.8